MSEPTKADNAGDAQGPVYLRFNMTFKTRFKLCRHIGRGLGGSYFLREVRVSTPI
jgi:hypothetical protein